MNMFQQRNQNALQSVSVRDAELLTKRIQEETERKKNEGGFWGGILGALGGAAATVLTGGLAAPAVFAGLSAPTIIGGIAGGLSGYQHGRETGDPVSAGAVGSLTGGLKGWETGESIKKATLEQEALSRKNLREQEKATIEGDKDIAQTKLLEAQTKNIPIESALKEAQIRNERFKIEVEKLKTLSTNPKLSPTDKDALDTYQSVITNELKIGAEPDAATTKAMSSILSAYPTSGIAKTTPFLKFKIGQLFQGRQSKESILENIKTSKDLNKTEISELIDYTNSLYGDTTDQAKNSGGKKILNKVVGKTSDLAANALSTIFSYYFGDHGK